MAAERAQEKKVSPEEFASWWVPIDACIYAAKCIVGADAAGQAIWRLLVAGMIEAAAGSMSLTPEDRSPITKNEPTFIPNGHWRYFTKEGSDLWNGGYARFWLIRGWGDRSAVFQAFGIRLNPADVRANLPLPRIEPAQQTPSPEQLEAPSLVPAPVSKGGRPPKEWWDDFWIDICKQIYEGDLKPKRQSDLEKAMLDWATNHGHEMSEATARKVAKKLFDAWKLGG